MMHLQEIQNLRTTRVAQIREAIVKRPENMSRRVIADRAELNMGNLDAFLYGTGSLSLEKLIRLEKAVIEMGLMKVGGSRKAPAKSR